MTTPHLYIVQHEINGERYMLPCVGDEELIIRASEADRYGAKLLEVVNIEQELRRFIWDCNFEGAMKEWCRDCA